MGATITLDDALTQRLMTRATDHDLSIQELSVRLIEVGLDDDDSISWKLLNKRRLDLISQKYTTGLTQHESDELEQLQQAAAGVTEPMDRRLLNQLEAFEQRAGIEPE